MPTDDDIAAKIVELCTARGPHKSICPSEAARALAPGEGAWREMMPDVRRVSGQLVHDGQIAATQRGADVDPTAARGAIRLRIRPLPHKA